LKLSTDDYVAINQLYARYAFAIDLHDLDGWLATWAPDGEYVSYDGRRTARGHDALRALAEAVVALPEEKGFHWNTNIVIEPAEYGASGKCYLMHVHALDGGRGEVDLAMYYRDELVKHDGRWLFRRRQTDVM
jgi:uncharacterized protein (TIGR02246 family)